MSPGLPRWVSPVVIAASFLLFAAAESRFPLRLRREPRLRRTGRNLALAGPAAAAAELLQIPVLRPVSAWVVKESFGVLNVLLISGWPRTLLAILLLDYTLWHWHFANHRVKFFWRFHLVHHVDRDLDASTGLRFHFGELALSVFFRALQIILIGADPASVSIYQVALSASVLFHHSNLDLSARFDRLLAGILVTPRMHGIHHSNVKEEADSNWSSLLSLWDRLHRTLRLDRRQQELVIGVPAFSQPGDVTVGKLLALPFGPPRDDWTTPEGPRADLC
jgi:sterol desaturase/sphingolipid hydroxylase (fatty acid hydroxylase superfamily)